MGLASQGTNGAPSSTDLGALFGLGARPAIPLEKHLKWEAPSLPPPCANGPPPPPPTAWPWMGRHQEGDQWQQRTLEPPATVVYSPTASMDAVKASQTEFAAMLVDVDHATHVGLADIVSLLDFLQSAQDEPDAHNTLALVQALNHDTVGTDALQAVVSLVADKAQLGTISVDELIDVLPLLVRLDNEGIAISSLPAVLNVLPEGDADRVAHFCTRGMLALTKDATVMKRWLDTLQACNHLQGRHHESRAWRLVYRQLARHFRPSEFSEHFGQVTKDDLARVMLRHWAPKLLRQGLGVPTTFCVRGMLFLRSHNSTPPGVQQLMAHYDGLRQRRLRYLPRVNRGQRSLIYLLLVLSSPRSTCPDLMHDVLRILKASSSPAFISITFDALLRCSSVGVTDALAVDLVRYFMSKPRNGRRDLLAAFRVFSAVPTIPLSKCFDLPLHLIKDGKAHGEMIFDILNRRVPGDVIPTLEREIYKQNLSPAHIELVQLVAWAFAQSGFHNSRVAFRRVWECYRFLCDRCAPLGTLMSRAMVHAGILRYLREQQPVPVAQMKYIVRLVEALEGRETADELYRVVHAWSATEKKRERREWGKRWAQERVEMEKRGRWKVRVWARKLGENWYDGGGAVQESTEVLHSRQWGIQRAGQTTYRKYQCGRGEHSDSFRYIYLE